MDTPLDPHWAAVLRHCAPANQHDQWTRIAEDAALSAALPALEGLLAAWPDGVRSAPASCFADVVVDPPSGPMDPPIERLRRWRSPPAWPWPLARAASLHFDHGIDASLLRCFPDVLPTGHLRRLVVRARLDAVAVGVAPMLAHAGLAGLTALSLDLLGVRADTVAAALDAMPQGIAALHLAWVRADIGAALGQALLARPALRALELHHCALSGTSWDALGASVALQPLDRLCLTDVPLDDRDAAAWARCAASGALRDLAIEAGQGAAHMQHGLAVLAEAGWLDGLRSLRIVGHGFCGAVFAQVRRIADWSRLECLHLEGPGDWTADAEALLAGRSRWPLLRHVRCKGGRMGRGTEARLAAAWPDREGSGL